jgi:hypothetical protein
MHRRTVSSALTFPSLGRLHVNVNVRSDPPTSMCSVRRAARSWNVTGTISQGLACSYYVYAWVDTHDLATFLRPRRRFSLKQRRIFTGANLGRGPPSKIATFLVLPLSLMQPISK